MTIAIAAFSVCILKRKLRLYDYIALIIIFIGLLVIQISNTIYSTPVGNQNMTVSFIALIGALLLASLAMVIEEWILRQYFILATEVVAYEGITALTFQLLLIIILCTTTCNTENHLCVYDPISQNASYENFQLFFMQMNQYPVLFITSLLLIWLETIVSYLMVCLTIYTNALTRAIVNMMRSVVIWIVGIIVSATTVYNWENL